MMNRRSFFGTVGALAVGARVAPAVASLPYRGAPLVFDPAPSITGMTFRGARIVSDADAPFIMGIDPASFHFWRAQGVADLTSLQKRAAMRQLYDRCVRGEGQ